MDKIYCRAESVVFFFFDWETKNHMGPDQVNNKEDEVKW